ncbi:unnamed protein product [Spirodela intermedia]|uniref:Uncharacterized protein n=1 Tax=Spirodela intermedia TaxID=51605 RepID=A0A7I8IQK0_SPIIN|nr:unnamed protein product [Spirodela intermedia]CAA6659814.1 unnamed protein product [Spirodela intermedia]
MRGSRHWGSVKQVTRSNFAEALQQIREHIRDADFIAVSSQKTGTAYLKAKVAAERFELLQFAICPFRLQGSKVVAYPDELNIGMPSYSFSCQTSFLSSMAREGFDFNLCIYDGLSYLSRVQESTAKHRNPVPIADTVFMERVKLRIEQWCNACRNSNPSEDALLRSLRKLMRGGDAYGSRPCLNIDVCNHRQVQLVAQVLRQSFGNLVPLITPDKGGELNVVKVVLTSSEEDRNLLLNEIQLLEEENEKKFRGFREVIDMISSSQKPVITYNALNDFTFIHSKFIGPLPSNMAEFMCSLRLVFPNIVDVNYLLREINPLRKANNIPAAMSYLRRQFFVPIEMEIPEQANNNTGKKHGHMALRITNLFAKLSLILKISPLDSRVTEKPGFISIENYANVFPPFCTVLRENEEEDVDDSTDDVRKVVTSNIVFLWGFGNVGSSGELKDRLRGSHAAFSEDFELAMVDKSCAVVVFWNPHSSQTLLRDIASGSSPGGPLSEMISDGLRVVGYVAYKKVCGIGLWETDLADSLEKSSFESDHNYHLDGGKETSEIYWNNELIINLNDL